MEFLFKNKPNEDFKVLGKICFDILTQEIVEKPFSEEFCGIWIDGRNRPINTIEDLASISSFYLYSEFKYPLLVFCHNSTDFLKGLDWAEKYPIKIIQIPEINSHDGYSNFCKKELPFLIPEKYENLLFLQCDAFLIRSGWERLIKKIDVSYIGSPWLHYPSIQLLENETWLEPDCQPSNVGNGAISYRKLSMMKSISERYGNETLREKGTENKRPAEDLFYSVFNNLYGKLATSSQASYLFTDPLTLEIFNNKTCFGGHFPVYKDRFKEKFLKG